MHKNRGKFASYCQIGIYFCWVIRFAFFSFLIFFCSCDQQSDSIRAKKKNRFFNDRAVHLGKQIPEYSLAEQDLLDSGLVDLHKLDSSIRVDLRYSTDSNFLGFDVYGNFRHAFLQTDAAAAFVKAQQALQTKRPGFSLVVYDAVRPMHIQRLMWDTLPMSNIEKQKYLSNPAKGGSLHNYGAAVDVSILDSNGRVLDMGTAYDFFGDKAHPVKEAEFLASGELNQDQIANRKLLREVMAAGGYWGIQTEWWHFNFCTRNEAMIRYRAVD
jgi:zinc D-Ala-D-Ala dipeptidase